MPRYRIITLVDITQNSLPNSDQTAMTRSQQSNFNSLIQAINLRSNVDWNTDPKKIEGRLPDPFSGKGNAWSWEFDCEREQVFEKGTDPVGLLKDDLDGVPIIVGLEDTVEFPHSAFITLGPNSNTYLEII